MLSLFPVLLLFLLVPFVLTLLAWRKGLQTIASGNGPTTGLRLRTLPPMLFLAGPVIALLGFFSLRMAHETSLATPGWMVVIGISSSVAALITSFWGPRDFRPLALFAAAAWVVCFGLALMMMLALAGLH